MPEPFVVWDGQLSPSPADTLMINVDGTRQPFDFTDCTLAFSMRPAGSATLNVDHEAAVIVDDPTEGNWRYDWQAGDTDTSGVGGPYRAFLTVTLPSGHEQDSPEFDIEIAVHAGAATPYLCSLDDVRHFLQKQGNQTASDEILQTLIAAASDEITRFCSREFAPLGTLTRTFRVDPPRNPRDPARIDFLTEDLRSIDDVLVNGVALAASAYALPPEDRRLPGTYSSVLIASTADLSASPTWASFGFATVDITGAWGAPAIPKIVNQGAYVTVAEWYRSKVAGFSTTFNDDGIHVAPAPLPTTVCGWLEHFQRYQA